jgi:hypothetical protein
MTLHLLKLAVGAGSLSDLQHWVAARSAQARLIGAPPEIMHTTRMVPKKIAELLNGGSLYWVIRGQLTCRQKLNDIRPFTDNEGISRCHLVLDSEVVAVQTRPFRPFQGWRYMTAENAPPDVMSGTDAAQMPETLRRNLADLGLI